MNGQYIKQYLCCTSNDGVDGTFITAHIGDVYKLCSLKEIYTGKFVVANTCIWERMADKNLLSSMKIFIRDIELWFAKQELSVDGNRIFRESTTLNDIGSSDFEHQNRSANCSRTGVKVLWRQYGRHSFGYLLSYYWG
jgi:hypothetical protein